MIRQKVLIGVGAICVVAAFSVSAAEQALGQQDRFKEISPSVQLFLKESPANASWPRLEDIKQKRVADEDVPPGQLEGTVNWIRKKIQDKWLPDDLKERLIPLRRLDGKNDYFIVRYQVDGWLVQIKDSTWLYITAKPVDALPDCNDINAFALKAVNSLVTVSSSTKNLKPWRETKKVGPNIYQGLLLPEWQHKSKPLSPIGWTSDGKAVYFPLEKRGGVDPKKDRGTPFEYISNINTEGCMGKMVMLKRKQKQEIGHKKFGLTDEEKRTKEKYDRLIRELENSPENPYRSSQYRKEQPKKEEESKVEPEKQPAPEQEQPEQESSNWLTPSLTVACVLLAGAVVFLLLRRRKAGQV